MESESSFAGPFWPWGHAPVGAEFATRTKRQKERASGMRVYPQLGQTSHQRDPPT